MEVCWLFREEPAILQSELLNTFPGTTEVHRIFFLLIVEHLTVLKEFLCSVLTPHLEVTPSLSLPAETDRTTGRRSHLELSLCKPWCWHLSFYFV